MGERSSTTPAENRFAKLVFTNSSKKNKKSNVINTKGYRTAQVNCLHSEAVLVPLDQSIDLCNTIKLDFLIKLSIKRDNSVNLDGVEETTFARICPSLFSRTSAMVNTFPFTNSVILFSLTSSW